MLSHDYGPSSTPVSSEKGTYRIDVSNDVPTVSLREGVGAEGEWKSIKKLIPAKAVR